VADVKLAIVFTKKNRRVSWNIKLTRI